MDKIESRVQLYNDQMFVFHQSPLICQLFSIVVVGMILVTPGGSIIGLLDQIRRSFFDFARSGLHFRCGGSSYRTIPEVNVVGLRCWLYCLKCRDKVYPYRSKLKGVNEGLFLNPLMKINSYTRKL